MRFQFKKQNKYFNYLISILGIVFYIEEKKMLHEDLFEKEILSENCPSVDNRLFTSPNINSSSRRFVLNKSNILINFKHGHKLRDKFDEFGIKKVFNQNLFDKDSFKNDQNDSIYKFTEFFDKNDLHARSYRKEKSFEKLIYGLPFQIFLSTVIILNSLMLGIQTSNEMKQSYQKQIAAFDAFSNGIFVIEFFLKLNYDFRVYWRNLWNLFDFVLLVIGLVSLAYDTEYSKSLTAGRLFRIFRVLRALRSIRSIAILHRMQIIINTFVKSIFDMVNIVALMLLTMVMFSLFGCNLFSKNEYFKDLDTGMLTIFYCATREGLSDLFESIHRSSNGDKMIEVVWKLFIMFIIVIFAFVLTNLIVAVVVTNMHQALTEDEKRTKDELYNNKKLINGYSEIPKEPENEINQLNIVEIEKFSKSI